MIIENLIKLKCEEVFYLLDKIWLRKDEMAFCRFCGEKDVMRKLFKVVMKEKSEGEE